MVNFKAATIIFSIVLLVVLSFLCFRQRLSRNDPVWCNRYKLERTPLEPTNTISKGNKPPVVIVSPPVMDLKYAIKARDLQSITAYLDGHILTSKDFDLLAELMNDPDINDEEKVSILNRLMEKADKEKLQFLLGLIQNSASDFKDRLLQVLSNLTTPDAMKLLIDTIFSMAKEPLMEMPEEEVMSGMIKTVIQNADYETTGQLFAEVYENNPEYRETLLKIAHPRMIAILVAESSDVQNKNYLLNHIIQTNDSRIINELAELSENNDLSADEANITAFGWADAHKQFFDCEGFEGTLLDENSSLSQRSIAAYVIAGGEPNSELAFEILDNARIAASPQLQEIIDSAESLVEES